MSKENLFVFQIPFFPVITKDLTFIHLGNDSIVDGLVSRNFFVSFFPAQILGLTLKQFSSLIFLQVNFEKLRLIAREVRQISKFNSIPYVSV